MFFPLVLGVYFLLNKFKKYDLAKVLLLLASLFFYGYFNWSYLPIIVFSIILNYIFSRIMLTNKNVSLKKCVFAISLILNIGSLFFFKYYDFFVLNVNNIFKSNITLLNLLLPLGISFFTFQQLSYVIDSYKKDVPLYSFFDYALLLNNLQIKIRHKL
jgi:D-alanyl-lipoteichoic acid acyltransferase DltB (MBOAT superfamily)